MENNHREREQEANRLEISRTVERNKNYTFQEFDSLRDRFPDEHIAVVNQAVVFHEKDLKLLLDKVHLHCKQDDGVFTFFIPAKPTDHVEHLERFHVTKIPTNSENHGALVNNSRSLLGMDLISKLNLTVMNNSAYFEPAT